MTWVLIGQWQGVRAGELSASPDQIAQDASEDGQEKEAEEAVETDDTLRIIVTAERTPDTPQDVPISLTVLTKQELEDAQIDSFTDIAQNTPNFFLFPSSPGNLPAYTIRGLGNNNFLSREAIGFFINDVPYDPGLFNDILLGDLERVEVLRGPQNLLYGRSSIGGVVNVVTRPPAEDFEVRTAASYGNEDLVNLQLSISDTLVPDTLALRLAGAFNRQDGLVENTFLDRDAVGDRGEGTGLAEL
ncbi:MAG: TonB-dependent receptor plug domain-containing protein, partial [Cyanobacteria bacterium P01_H01_bin.26]